MNALTKKGGDPVIKAIIALTVLLTFGAVCQAGDCGQFFSQQVAVQPVYQQQFVQPVRVQRVVQPVYQRVVQPVVVQRQFVRRSGVFFGFGF